MIRDFIAKLTNGYNLTQEEATRLFQIMMTGGATPAQIAAVLVALRIKGETIAEITGAAITMIAKMDAVDAPENAIDVCGTGGDAHKVGGTLNVSTAVALVVAACGVPVVKHGNKSVSSSSGSADVLTALGVNIQADKAQTELSLKEANIGFMFAPLYHKAMRHVAPVRQELGLRTIFNLLGPIVNPAKPKYQLLGVYDQNLLTPMVEVLRALGSKKAWVVCGSDGMDELTLSGISHVAELDNNAISYFDVSPEDAGIEIQSLDAIKGKDPESNAKELSLLLNGKKSAYRDIVALNAAAALMIAGKATNLKEGAALAAEALDNGKAKETFANLVRITNQL